MEPSDKAYSILHDDERDEWADIAYREYREARFLGRVEGFSGAVFFALVR